MFYWPMWWVCKDLLTSLKWNFCKFQKQNLMVLVINTNQLGSWVAITITPLDWLLKELTITLINQIIYSSKPLFTAVMHLKLFCVFKINILHNPHEILNQTYNQVHSNTIIFLAHHAHFHIKLSENCGKFYTF